MWITTVIITAILISIVAGIILVRHNNKTWFHRLREAVQTWDTYEIRKSDGLFGSFWDSKDPVYVVCAASSRHAMERYFRHYRKVYNEYNDYDNKPLHETTYGWGVFQVKNIRSGFKRYFH